MSCTPKKENCKVRVNQHFNFEKVPFVSREELVLQLTASTCSELTRPCQACQEGIVLIRQPFFFSGDVISSQDGKRLLMHSTPHPPYCGAGATNMMPLLWGVAKWKGSIIHEGVLILGSSPVPSTHCSSGQCSPGLKDSLEKNRVTNHQESGVRDETHS